MGYDEEDIDLDEDIQELGFDSAKLTAFAEQLSTSMDVELSPGLFFEYNTLGGVVEYLNKYHADKVKELLAD